jgi:AmmeMemoRadiSam system protein B
MNISSYSREELTRGLERAKSNRISTNGQNISSEAVRVMFSPGTITSENIDEVYELYSHIEEGQYDTVVVVESHPGSAEKKLPMPSFKSVTTPLGEIMANDRLRNDFCDEDDDFYINDDAFDTSLCLYDQLMMLQCSLKKFSVVSIQITDENPYIVKELAFALEEILASKNALVVFCCDLDESHRDEFEKVMQFYNNHNYSSMMNYLAAADSSMKGAGTFMAGLLVSSKWGLSLNFNHKTHSDTHNLLIGFAEMQHQPIFG